MIVPSRLLGDLLEQIGQKRAAHLALDFARHVLDLERDEIEEPVWAACLEYVEACHEAIDLGKASSAVRGEGATVGGRRAVGHRQARPRPGSGAGSRRRAGRHRADAGQGGGAWPLHPYPLPLHGPSAPGGSRPLGRAAPSGRHRRATRRSSRPLGGSPLAGAARHRVGTEPTRGRVRRSGHAHRHGSRPRLSGRRTPQELLVRYE